MRPLAVLVALAILLLAVQPAAALGDRGLPIRADLPDVARRGQGAPVQDASEPPEPALALAFDLPHEANGGEVIIATLHIDVPDGGTVRNVTVRAEVDEAYVVLPSWHHDAWRGGDLVWHLDEVAGAARVFFHVQAPATPTPLETSFTAEAVAGDGGGATAHDVTVRPATEPDASRAQVMAVVAVGYVATLTAPPVLNDVLP